MIPAPVHSLPGPFAASGRLSRFSMEALQDRLAFEHPVWLEGFCFDSFLGLYFLCTSEAVLAVDSGWDKELTAEAVDFLIDILKSRGLAPERWYLLITHKDWDHAWGIQAFLQHPLIGSKVCVLSSAAAISALNNDLKSGAAERASARDSSMFARSSIVIPDYTVCEGDDLDLGGNVKVNFMEFSAHCRGQIGAAVPELSLLFGADFLEEPLPFLASPHDFLKQKHDLIRVKALNFTYIFPSHKMSWSIKSCCPAIADHFCSDILDGNLRLWEGLEEAAVGCPEDVRGKVCAALEDISSAAGCILYDDESWEEGLKNGSDLPAWLKQEEFKCGMSADVLLPGIVLNDFYMRAYHLAWIGAMQSAQNRRDC